MNDRLASLAGWIYRGALLGCPRAFRRRHGRDMRATFEALVRDAAARGSLAFAAVVARELADVARAAVRARLAPPSVPPSSQRSRPVGALWQDVRYASRMLRRQPGFAAVAVVTLALGIGATTAVFTVVNGVLLRPLAYGHPDRLVVLLYGKPGRLSPWFSPINFQDVTRDSQAFSAAAAATPTTVNLTGSADPERVDGALVSWNYFDVLEVAMRRGRGFAESDGQGDGNVVVISDGLWQRRFGGRPDAIGSTLKLDGRACTVVGVAPPDMKLPAGAELWQPLIFKPGDVAETAAARSGLRGSRALAPGVDLDRANVAVGTVARRLAEAYRSTNADRIAARRRSRNAWSATSGRRSSSC